MDVPRSAARGAVHSDADAVFLVIKRECPTTGAERMREFHQLIDRRIPVVFLVYRPDEFEQRLTMDDPFVKSVLREGEVLYG